ncbi:MAG: prolipoprotein diacylglyceryl transferase [Acidobacteriota bacterium]
MTLITFLPHRQVLAQIGDIEIRWYGLMYAIAFWAAWWLLPRLQWWRGIAMSRSRWTEMVAWGSVGALIGGRIGYAILYEPGFFAAHPLELFAYWRGGMSSHGGFIGAGLLLWWQTRRLSLTEKMSIADISTIPVSIGLALGRVGNFINGELFSGHAALYAAGANVAIAALLSIMLRKQAGSAGFMVGTFFVLYSAQRMLLETFRTIDTLIAADLTLGQLYTVPLLGLGVFFLVKSYYC